MKNSLNLSIPKPCQQKWENFSPTKGGGYCDSCSKVVVDFTSMSDEQILAHFQLKDENTCGRFRPDQLKAYQILRPLKINTGFSLLKAGLLGLLFVINSRNASAQTPTEKPKTETASDSKYYVDQNPSGGLFRGIVRSREDHQPLPGVNVILKGTTIGTVTDHEGRFEFPQKLEQDDVLIFSFIGLVAKEFKFTNRTNVGIDVPMDLCLESDITGEVAVSGLYSRKSRSFWSKVKSLF